MSRRKILCFLIAVMMVVTTFFSMVCADENTFTTRSGITVTAPQESNLLIWDDMPDDYPSIVNGTISRETLDQIYEQIGLSLSTYINVSNTESYSLTVNERTADPELSDSEWLSYYYLYDPVDENDIFTTETVSVNGIEYLKTYYQNDANDGTAAVYQYSFLSDDGKRYDITIGLTSAEQTPTAFTPVELTDPESSYAYLAELSDSIIASVELSDELKSSIIPFDSQENDVTEVSEELVEETVTSVPTEAPAPKKSAYEKFLSFEFPTWLILVALAIVLFAGAKVSKIKQWQEEPLSLENSKAIQGFCAVAIIIHHLAQDLLGRAGILQEFSEFGVLFVGVFFFFSGYGLYTSLKSKDNYLKGFLKKRLKTILIPFYVCIAVFVVAACICGQTFDAKRLISVLTGWSLINDNMWYIVEITILYILFFVIYRLIKNRTVATAVMSVCTIGMIVGSLLLGHGSDMSCSFWFMGEWWYNSTLLFLVGILVSKHSDILRKIARKGYIFFLILFGGLTVWFSFLTKHVLQTYSYWSEIPGVDPAYADKFRCLSVQLPWIIFFVCFLLLVMMKVRFGNPVLKFLGSISLELYLCHNLFRLGLQDGSIARIHSASMLIALTILLSIGLATVLSGVDKYLIALVSGKKKDLTLADESSRIHSIDLMRFVMAFLVVCIHFPFNGKVGEVFFTYGRTAVPFFLAVCGYMLYRDDSKDMMKRLIKQTKRIAIFYVAGAVFYVIASIITIRVDTGSFAAAKMLYNAKTIPNFLLYNFWEYAEHLWFLGSLLYALVIMIVLNKLKVLKNAIFAGPVLIACYVVLSHLGIGEYYQLRNAILVGLSYTLTGMIIRRYEKKILSFKYLTPVLCTLFVITCATAMVELNTYEQGADVPIISCEILTYVILLLCLKFRNFGKDTFMEKLGRECSLPIYMVHIAVIMLLTRVIPSNSGFMSNYGAITVFVVTTVGVAIYENIKHAIKETKTPEEHDENPEPAV